MDISIEDAITELYGKIIVQEAAIKLLYGMLLGYVQTENSVKAKALVDLFPQRLAEFVSQEVLSSRFSEEYQQHIVEQFLKSFPGIDLSSP
jgi:hypothetical protein